MNFVGKQLKGQGLLALSVNLLYLAVLIHQSHGQMSSDPSKLIFKNVAKLKTYIFI